MKKTVLKNNFRHRHTAASGSYRQFYFFQLAQLLHVADTQTCISCPPLLERLIRDAMFTTRALAIAQMQDRPSFGTCIIPRESHSKPDQLRRILDAWIKIVYLINSVENGGVSATQYKATALLLQSAYDLIIHAGIQSKIISNNLPHCSISHI